MIAFRADASIQMGTGHVMRCLTLADALRERGVQCLFICRPHRGHLLELIAHRGHRAMALPTLAEGAAQEISADPAHAVWLGTDWATDAQDTRHALGDNLSDWLVVDHYALDRRWEQAMRSVCQRLMVIDDLADRLYDCDLLLDQNLGRVEKDYQGLVPSHCVRLIGPTYALLRPEFEALRPYSLARRQTAKFQHLLITMGGVDKDNATGRVLEALRGCPFPKGLQITIVMGPHAPWLEQVRMQATQMSCPTQVLVGVSNMAQLMADSDLAIGAAGSTSWERCCLGLPSIILALADNQYAGANALQDAGAGLAARDMSEFQKLLRQVFASKAMNCLLQGLSKAAQRVCNGRGITPVVQNLLLSAYAE